MKKTGLNLALAASLSLGLMACGSQAETEVEESEEMVEDDETEEPVDERTLDDDGDAGDDADPDDRSTGPEDRVRAMESADMDMPEAE